MNPRAPQILLAVITALTVVTVSFLVEESRHSLPARGATEFQRMIGGLGLGPDIDMSRCAFSFDPRLGVACSDTFSPIPGGVHFCPRHAGSVLYVSQRQTVAGFLPETLPDANLR